MGSGEKIKTMGELKAKLQDAKPRAQVRKLKPLVRSKLKYRSQTMGSGEKIKTIGEVKAKVQDAKPWAQVRKLKQWVRSKLNYRMPNQGLRWEN